VNQSYAATLQRQIEAGQSSDDEAAETEAFSTIRDHLLKPIGSAVRGMMGFGAIIRIGELRAQYCVRQHHNGDSDMLRQASMWIEEAEQMQRKMGVPFGSCYGQLVADLECAIEIMSQSLR
jgi:hypothetical protein